MKQPDHPMREAHYEEHTDKEKRRLHAQNRPLFEHGRDNDNDNDNDSDNDAADR